MKVLNQIGLGKLSGAAPATEDPRVLDLFRNRAELKKAYSELQDEIHRLKERLRQQEGATTRVQEILATLETRLEDREQGYSTMVFYQLRRLWQAGHEVLASYAVDLEREHVDRERRAFFVEFNRQQFARRQQSEAELTQAQRAAIGSRQSLRDCEQKLAQLNRPWHRFQRRELEQQLATLRSSVAAAELALGDARQKHEGLAAEAEQGFDGLSVDARRIINLELIACAELLCLRLIKSPLLALARAAATRREAGDSYGSRQDCESLMSDIDLARAVLEQRKDLATEVKARAARLASAVKYESDAATVPMPESLQPARAPLDPLAAALDKATRERRAKEDAEPRPPNVLAEDSWDLFRVLLH